MLATVSLTAAMFRACFSLTSASNASWTVYIGDCSKFGHYDAALHTVAFHPDLRSFRVWGFTLHSHDAASVRGPLPS